LVISSAKERPISGTVLDFNKLRKNGSLKGEEIKRSRSFVQSKANLIKLFHRRIEQAKEGKRNEEKLNFPAQETHVEPY
jgi:adenylosuccinate synthase